MFDILVYLFENYLPDACPEPDVLAKKLTAIGFEDEDISQALDWLAGFPRADEVGASHPALAASRALRLYDPAEIAKLPAACRGFMAFLEQAGALDAPARELILERALALPEAVVSLAKLKVIVLLVVWRRQLPLDALIFEELLADDDEDDEDSGSDSPPFH